MGEKQQTCRRNEFDDPTCYMITTFCYNYNGQTRGISEFKELS